MRELLAAKDAALPDAARAEIDGLIRMLNGNLAKIVEHGKRADSIVKNMLLHSRTGAGERRPTNLNALIVESLNLAYHGARAEKPDFNVTLRRDLDPAIGEIELYPQEITRVLLNLFGNGFYAVRERQLGAREPGFEPTSVGRHAGAGRPGRDSRARQRHRHTRGGENENLRSVLHHQTGGRGDRPRPVPELRHRRQAARRQLSRSRPNPARSPSSS